MKILTPIKMGTECQWALLERVRSGSYVQRLIGSQDIVKHKRVVQRAKQKTSEPDGTGRK